MSKNTQYNSQMIKPNDQNNMKIQTWCDVGLKDSNLNNK